jgi:hypothetical protein
MHVLDFPLAVFVISFGGLWAATRFGTHLGKRSPAMEKEEQEYFNIVLTATLTLLGLIIGFTFSMAVSRYDLRKHYEAIEANTIGTEYLRVDLLAASDRLPIRDLLKEYLKQRILFYTTSGIAPGSGHSLKEIDAHTTQLQAQMWSLVQRSASQAGTATAALTASGMNEVIDSQGYAQAAWWNRIPVSGWALMGAIALCCSVLMAFAERDARPWLVSVLPTILAIAFFLMADIDSPRNGIIRVLPHDLLSLSQSLNAR